MLLSERINDRVDKEVDLLIKEVSKVVQIPSVIGNENEMQESMIKRYKSIGLKVETLQPEYDKVKKHPAFCDSGLSFEGRKNVIGILEGDAESPSLTLNAHVDVVSPEPIQKWTKDPWGGEVVGNKLYGRGSGDMKAGLIANWLALKVIIDLGIKPKGSVYLQSVIEEEAGGAGGTLSCMEAGYLTDGFIVSEPHGLKITVAHAGVMYFRVKVLGKTAHAGLAHLGINALEKMYLIFNALNDLGKKRSKEVYYKLFHEGSGQSVHLNLGTLTGGDWASNVPGEAILEGRIGFIPSESRLEIKTLIHSTIEQVIEVDSWLKNNRPEIEWYGWTTEAWQEDKESLYVKSFQKTAQNTLGKDVELAGRASGNDARFTQYYNRSGLCFGPVVGNMHGPDEYVEIDSLIKTVKVLANHIVDWCGVVEDA